MGANRWTPELQEAIVKDIAEGMWVQSACKKHGIGRKTFYRWLEKGTSGEEPYAAFAEAIDRAEGDLEHRWVRSLETVNAQWQRFAWLLEHRFPNAWGTRTYDKPTVDNREETNEVRIVVDEGKTK